MVGDAIRAEAAGAQTGAEASQRRLVFVLGCPHSGTSAFVRLLNRHPKICIGLERYKFHLRDHGRIDPAVFSKERFFDLRREDTDRRRDPIWSDLRRKWDAATVVGDKIPSLFNYMDSINNDFPEARFVHLVRDAGAVASSWNRRAPRTGRDHSVAVGVWNKANRIALAEARRRPERWIAVSYETLFRGDAAALARIVGFLGLERDEALIDAHREAVTLYHARYAGDPDEALPGQAAFVRRHADLATARRLIAHDPGRARPLAGCQSLLRRLTSRGGR